MPAVATPKRKPRRGQPRRAYKGDAKPRILQEILEGVPKSKAGPAAGVTRQTFYTWIESDPAFALAVEAVEAERAKMLVKMGERCARGKGIGNARMIEVLLRPLCREFRDEKPEVHVSASATAAASASAVAISPGLVEEIQRQRRLQIVQSGREGLN